VEYSLKTLSRMRQSQLDEVFRGSSAGKIPDGRFRGTFLVAPGTVLTSVTSELIRTMVWQGKVFDAQHGRVKNLVLPFGFESVSARVYKAGSWFDSKECIVLDYSENILRAVGVRDEIREIASAVYLGKVYIAGMRMPDFLLEREEPPAA
jgi:hypothetical protein